jgi:hypothetical protein
MGAVESNGRNHEADLGIVGMEPPRERLPDGSAFLPEMDAVIPWQALAKLIEPHYPKAGNGRQPMPLERMWCIHLMRHGLAYMKSATIGLLH